MNKIIVSALFLVLSIELSKSFPKTYLVETETGKSIIGNNIYGTRDAHICKEPM